MHRVVGNDSAVAFQDVPGRSLCSLGKFLAAIILLLTITFTIAANPERLPPGVYATTVNVDDVPAAFPPEAVAILVGQWQVEFTEGGSVVVTKDGDIVVVARYTSTPTHVEITDVLGALACLDEVNPVTGSYSWALNNRRLTLTLDADLCDARVVVLTTSSLQDIAR